MVLWRAARPRGRSSECPSDRPRNHGPPPLPPPLGTRNILADRTRCDGDDGGARMSDRALSAVSAAFPSCPLLWSTVIRPVRRSVEVRDAAFCVGAAPGAVLSTTKRQTTAGQRPTSPERPLLPTSHFLSHHQLSQRCRLGSSSGGGNIASTPSSSQVTS